jgi:TRAP-type C4-dicarboxylate transport system permease large subunit
VSDVGIVTMIWVITVLACVVRVARARSVVEAAPDDRRANGQSVQNFCVAAGILVPVIVLLLIGLAGGTFTGSHNSAGLLFLGVLLNVVFAGFLGRQLARRL